MRRIKLVLLSALLAIVLASPAYAWTEYDNSYSYRSYSSRYETYQPKPVEREVYSRYYYRDRDRLDPPYREYRYYYHEPESHGLRIHVPFFSFRLG